MRKGDVAITGWGVFLVKNLHAQKCNGLGMCRQIHDGQAAPVARLISTSSDPSFMLAIGLMDKMPTADPRTHDYLSDEYAYSGKR